MQIQDETWQIEMGPNPSLPCPADNNGNLPKGYVYSKVRRDRWSL